MICEFWKSGYCSKYNSYVSNDWCFKKCKKKPNPKEPKRIDVDHVMERSKKRLKDSGIELQGTEPKVHPKPTLAQMAVHFTKAMTKWIAKGVPVCTKEEYIARRKACSECHNGRSCPVCGCNLWAKAAVKTEKCPLGKWNL